MSDVFRNWIVILFALTVALGLATTIGEATTPRIQETLQAAILLVAAGIGVTDAIMRILGRSSLLGHGRGFGRLLAVAQLVASLLLAMSLLMI